MLTHQIPVCSRFTLEVWFQIPAEIKICEIEIGTTIKKRILAKPGF